MKLEYARGTTVIYQDHRDDLHEDSSSKKKLVSLLFVARAMSCLYDSPFVPCRAIDYYSPLASPCVVNLPLSRHLAPLLFARTADNSDTRWSCLLADERARTISQCLNKKDNCDTNRH